VGETQIKNNFMLFMWGFDHDKKKWKKYSQFWSRETLNRYFTLYISALMNEYQFELLWDVKCLL
jgi:hypothetical protein